MYWSDPVDKAVRIVLHGLCDLVERRAELGLEGGGIDVESHAVGQVHENRLTVIDLGHVDTRSGSLFLQFLDLLVHLVADCSTSDAADACADDPARAATDQAAEQQTCQRAARSDRSRARNLFLAGIRIGDAAGHCN